MFNRKATNLFFMSIIVFIVLGSILLRYLLLDMVDKNIEKVERLSDLLEVGILELENQIEINKDVQAEEKYLLYKQVPDNYNENELVFYIYSKLDSVGITENIEYDRELNITEGHKFLNDSKYFESLNDLNVVRLNISFNTTSLTVIQNLLDEFYNSDQVLIVERVNFFTPNDVDLSSVTLEIYAVYNQ